MQRALHLVVQVKEKTNNKSRLLPDSSRLKSIIRGSPFGRGHISTQEAIPKS